MMLMRHVQTGEERGAFLGDVAVVLFGDPASADINSRIDATACPHCWRILQASTVQRQRAEALGYLSWGVATGVSTNP